MKPHTKAKPCPVCSGHRDLLPGKGQRCFGFTSDDGAYAHCSREELAGGLPQDKAMTYAHRLAGDCRCGTRHGGDVTPIGDASRTVVAEYDYRDEEGRLRYQVVRFHPKTFRQRRPEPGGGWNWKLDGARPLLYRLPELIQAVAAGDTIYVVEGEKDADRLCSAGVMATCNSGGAGKWLSSFSGYFQNARVVIVRDKDKPGTEHAREVFRQLRPVASDIRVVEARTGKDASDHLDAKHTLAELVPVWPAAADLRLSDPVAWKRRMLRMSFDATDPIRTVNAAEALARPNEPRWPTGLRGETTKLPNFRGVVIVAGVPSSGKSYLALASGIDAALAGWDVLYLSCEMSERVLAKRVIACALSGIPETFHHVDVSYGASVEGLLEWVEARVTERPTLVIFDSVSSFCDQAEQLDSDDPHGLTLMKKLVMWAINVRRATDGQVSFVLLAEANREGRARGRTADHKADLALLMESDDKNDAIKNLRVTKAWEYATGRVGEFGIDVESGRLVRL